LPAQALAGEVEAYDSLHHFIRIITTEPTLLTHRTPLHIYNSSDPTIIQQAPHGQALAFKHGVKLARYGLQVNDVKNAPAITTGTYLDIYGT
jgi:hypothetical protein